MATLRTSLDGHQQQFEDDEENLSYDSDIDLGQLTFTSNKTFPLDLHYHHHPHHNNHHQDSDSMDLDVVDQEGAMMLSAACLMPGTRHRTSIDSSTSSTLFETDPMIDSELGTGGSGGGGNSSLSSVPGTIRPPPPSPSTPPLYMSTARMFQSTQSMPIPRMADDDGDAGPDDDADDHHEYEHNDDGGGDHETNLITPSTVDISPPSQPPIMGLSVDPSTEFDPANVPPPPYNSYADSDTVDHQSSAQVPPVTVIIHEDVETLPVENRTINRNRSLSHSTNELNQCTTSGMSQHQQRMIIDQDQLLKPPTFEQAMASAGRRNMMTPTPYARLKHFQQHHQHLQWPNTGTGAAGGSMQSYSTVLRRQSMPSFTGMATDGSMLPGTVAGEQSALGVQGASGLAKEKRIGHRRVNDEGQVTYKKIKSTQIMYSIQLGIGYSVGSMASKPERDLLMQDFMQIETVHFPKSGSSVTPAHHFTDFTFSTYTPFAFRYFRDLSRIQPDDFMISITNEPLQELSNPGASGSMFFRTKDDQFIIKTVEKNEAKFLLKLLPGYYMNLCQNAYTLLPRFLGLYCYQCIGKNIRILVMNNILPSNIKIHQKYDLKGSTYKRKANAEELKKSSPTYKDLDFLTFYYQDEENKKLITHFNRLAELPIGDQVKVATFPTKGGLLLEAHVYDELMDTLKRDCRVLQSFEIMDYSMLIGVHNYDQTLKENDEQQRLFDYDNDEELPPGAIRAMNRKGERLLLFIGIIDILQSYRLVKKVEHAWKTIFNDGASISVTNPNFYAKRFLDFMSNKVFGRLPDATTTSLGPGVGTPMARSAPSTRFR